MMSAHDLQGIVQPRAITDLAAAVEQLPEAERARFDRLFHVSASTGTLVAPESMYRWIESFFGSVAAVEEQRIVKTTNRVTLEGTVEDNEQRSVCAEIAARIKGVMDVDNRLRFGAAASPSY